MNIKRQSALNKKQNKVNTNEKNCMLPKENKLVCLANRYCVLFEWNAQLNNHKIILMKLFVTKTIDRQSKKVNIHVIWLELIGFAVLSLSKKKTSKCIYIVPIAPACSECWIYYYNVHNRWHNGSRHKTALKWRRENRFKGASSWINKWMRYVSFLFVVITVAAVAAVSDVFCPLLDSPFAFYYYFAPFLVAS